MLIDFNGKNASDSPLMSLTAFSIQGKRNHMEDFFDIGYQLKPVELRGSDEWPYEFFYFGIFDGHGGNEASKFAKRHLVKFITRQEDFWSNDDEDVMRAIRKGFADTHSAMRHELPKWTRTSKTFLPSTAGTTASVLFIKNGKYYTGHVGDSRIVVSRENSESKQWIPNQLTDDHKPELEIDRIRRAGGDVREKTGVQRVVWKRPVLIRECESNHVIQPDTEEYYKIMKQVSNYPVDESLVSYYQFIPFLAIARSLGDFWSINPYSGLYVVSPEPDVSCQPVHPDDTGIILATDGLWNVMDAMKAVRILQELEMKNKYKQHDQEHFIIDNYYNVAGDEPNSAQSLVYFAYQIWERKRTRSDNITVVFARLWDTLSMMPKSAKPYSTRLSLHQNNQKQSIVQHYLRNRPELVVQIKTTQCYAETIDLGGEPTFDCKSNGPCATEMMRSNLEYQLLLPPTIIDPNIDIIPPKNYTLLSKASVRVISLFDDDYDNTVIRLKTVTDDPADLVENAEYVNARGKTVKDSSAQVSDGIHDFGQPWDQLQQNLWDLEDYSSERWDEGGDINELDRAFEEWEKDEKHEEDNEEDQKIEADHEARTPSIPQLRCLINCFPPLRRSKRRIYLSMSEDAKKKCHCNPVQIIPKNKRRKSQPANCNMVKS